MIESEFAASQMEKNGQILTAPMMFSHIGKANPKDPPRKSPGTTAIQRSYLICQIHTSKPARHHRKTKAVPITEQYPLPSDLYPQHALSCELPLIATLHESEDISFLTEQHSIVLLEG